MRPRAILLITFMFVIVTVSGQSSQGKAIVGATLIDSIHAPLKDAVIIIEGAHIREVGERGKIEIPEGAKIIDARGKFVIPGLADMHDHLDVDGYGLSQGPPDAKRNLARMLAWGYTTIFDPAVRQADMFSELKRVSADDAAPYPHYFAVGRPFGAKGGHGPASSFRPDTPEEARAAVRELKKTNVDAVKIFYSDLIYVTKQVRPMLKPDVVAAIIDEAHQHELKVYVHVPVLKYAKEILRAGADGLVHGILSDPIDDEFISLMKKNRAVYITTHTVFQSVSNINAYARRAAEFDKRGMIASEIHKKATDPETARTWEARWDNLDYMKKRIPILQANTRKVWESGILVVAGSDLSGGFLGLASQMELMLLVDAGLTPQQAIQAATINAARMVGREKEMGSVERGKLADLLILDADPLADIRHIHQINRVVKGGVVHDPAELLRTAR